MKLVIIALALVAVAIAAPAGPAGSNPDAQAQTISENFDQRPEGSYNYAFKSDNGIDRNEEGELKTVNDEENKPHEVVVVRGSYSYTDASGQPIKIEYYADETGFHAEGDAVPKASRR